jgi:multidrug efflux pump subunit AcrA (membrane-fusion protein)
MIEPELHRKRGRAWLFCGAVAAAVVVLIGIIRVPTSITADGVLEPMEQYYVKAGSPGFVKEIKVKDAQPVKKGDVLVVLSDEALDAKIASLEAELERLKIQHRASSVLNQAQRLIDEKAIANKTAELNDQYRRRDELTIRAPIDGYVVAPQIHQYDGRYLHKGDAVAQVAQLERLYVYAAVDQNDAELLFTAPHATEVRLVGRPNRVLYAEHPQAVPAAVREARAAAQTQHGGGQIPNDPSDPTGRKYLVPPFELRAELANPQGRYVPGQRAYVRMLLDEKPLIWRWTRRFLQVIQSKSGSSKWL